MILSVEIKNFIRAHAKETHPEECCGLVILDGAGAVEPIRCENSAHDKLNFFKISPQEYLKAYKRGKIIASYHSHGQDDSDKFSEFDKQASRAANLHYIMYSHEKDAFLEYDPKMQFDEYIGRVFFWGKNDCFSLVRNFYRKEFSIEIPDFLTDRLGNESSSPLGVYGKLIEDHFKEYGWEKIDKFEEIKKYDGLCFDFGREGLTSHVGVYLGNNLILHHPRGGYSCVENVNVKSLKFFRMALRNPNL